MKHLKFWLDICSELSSRSRDSLKHRDIGDAVDK
jgi:hypothetical protein